MKNTINISKKYTTRDGRDVTILKTNFRSETYPILAIIHEEFKDVCATYTEYGYYKSLHEETIDDLMEVKKRKEGWIILHNTGVYGVYDTEKQAKAFCSSDDVVIKIEWMA